LKGAGIISISYLERARKLVLSALDELGYVLVDISEKFARSDYLVSIVVWKNSGIGIEDCVKITKKLHPMLENDSEIPTYVRLEVSSPGIDRKLRNLEELNIFKGMEVTLHLTNRTHMTGKSNGIKDENAIIDVDGNVMSVPLSEVTSARLIG
jgi:ribosome maturation factor RimP